jgi:hypothetical protein
MDIKELEVPVLEQAIKPINRKKKRNGVEYNYYTTYLYRGVPYIPHYRKADCYIPPGYAYDTGMTTDKGEPLYSYHTHMERTSGQLEKAGALRKPEYLMERDRTVPLMY